MKFLSLAALSLLSSTSLHATNYAFVDPKHPWHLDGSFAQVAPASFSTHNVKDTKLHYSEANGSLYYTHFLTPRNSLSWQAGYSFLGIHWKENPRFRQENFGLANASLGWVSTSIDKWRWIFRVGGSVDAQRFDVGNSGVIYGLAWGRYCINPHLSLHTGIFGFMGVHSNYVLPIAGFDYTWGKWKFNLIFPMDSSLTYHFTPSWSLGAVYLNFGGPYRYPYRAHEGIGRYQNAILQVYSTAAALKLKYRYGDLFSLAVSGGWNLGGWLFIRDHAGHHGKYYKYNGAPYVEGRATLTF